MGSCDRPGGMEVAVTPDGKAVAVGIHLDGSNSLMELYDVDSDTFVSTVPVGVRPFHVVLSPDNVFVYSVDHDSFTITAIELRSRTATTIGAASLGYGEFDKPHYAADRDDGTHLLPFDGETAILTGGYTFADGGWDGVTRVDLETGERSTLIVPGRPFAIARLN